MRTPAPLPLEVTPLRLGNLAPALRIAWGSFEAETLMVGLTYAWSMLRDAGFPVEWMMARRRRFAVLDGGQKIASLELVHSVIHGGDVGWASLDAAAHDRQPVIDFIRWRYRRYRIIIFRQASDEHEFASGSAFEATLPGPDDGTFRLFGYERQDTPPAKRFEIRALPAVPLRINAKFHVANRGDKAIGLTGLYTVDFWPAIVWGGWGALTREAGHRRTGIALLHETEQLARAQGGHWFMIETSDGPAYRAARFIYELYGLSRLLEIPGFYADGEGYIVYGKRIEAPARRTETLVQGAL